MNNLLAILSFLTIIPTKDYDLIYIAKNMYLFPVAGLIIGSIIGLLSFLPMNEMILASIIVLGLLIITGAHHIDGLADFADALMVKGSKEVKKRVIHDPATGSAGVSAIVIYFICSIIALSSINNNQLYISIIVSEVLAKFSMVLLAYTGRSAWEGMGSLFVNLIDLKRFLIGLILTIIIVYTLASLEGFYALILSIVTTLSILKTAERSFGGISGDVFGATNEIIRVVNFILLAHLNIRTPFMDVI